MSKTSMEDRLRGSSMLVLDTGFLLVLALMSAILKFGMTHVSLYCGLGSAPSRSQVAHYPLSWGGCSLSQRNALSQVLNCSLQWFLLIREAGVVLA